MRRRLTGILLSIVLAATSVDLTAFATEPTVQIETADDTLTTEETKETEENSQEKQAESESETKPEESSEANTENETKPEENSEQNTESEPEFESSNISEEESETQTQSESAVETSETETESASESETDIQDLLDAEGNIASGTFDDIIWVIDADGKLTVSGSSSTYNRDNFPWFNYRDSIISAEVNVQSIKYPRNLFYLCENLKSVDLNNFSTSDSVNMSGMFKSCRSLESVDLSNFDTGNVTNMSEMFSGCSKLKRLDLNGFNTSKVTNMYNMFASCWNLSSLAISNFDTSSVVDMQDMFRSCDKLVSLDLSNFNTGNVKYMGGMFSGCEELVSLDLSNFNTSNVTGMAYLFQDCKKLENLNIKSFDTSKVKSMTGMFEGCDNLANLDLSNFNTSSVKHMEYMFFRCGLSSIDLSNFDTSKVENMSNMFAWSDKLERVDLSNFNTANVTDMHGMFNDCPSITSLDLSSFNTAKVTSMCEMFWGCGKLEKINLCNFDTRQVTIMVDMFKSCYNLKSLDLSNFNMVNVTDASGMLEYDNSLSDIYAPYNVKVTIGLPTETNDIWYRSDGSTVTELPQNLDHSVALGRNYVPEEKGDPDPGDEDSKQLTDTGSAVFQFRDSMTGAPIIDGKVCIEEEFTGTHYYQTNSDGSITIPVSKGCERIFISTHFKGYEDHGGWTPLSSYRTDAGTYLFRLNPSTKYTPKLPSINTSVNTSAPDVKTEDGDVSMFNMKMDFELNFGRGLKFKREYDKNERTVKVAFSTEGKLSYDMIKQKYKASGILSSKSLDEEFDEGAGTALNPGKAFGIKGKLNIEGYLKCNEMGDLIEGGVIFTSDISGETQYRPACTAGVAYAKFKLGMTVKGTWKLTYVDGNINSSGKIKLEPYATIAVGVGWELAHFEVGATGKFSAEMTIPFKNSKESLTIDAVFEVYSEAVFLFVGNKHSYEFTRNIWPAVSFSNLEALNNGTSGSDLEILPRDYLAPVNKNVDLYGAQSEQGLTSSESFRYSEISPDSGVFKENNVQYVRLSNGTEIIAWAHDFGDKSDANRTTLVYSVNKNDGTGWGSITPVCSDTATGDYYPNMIAEGNKAYLVWNKASKEFEDDANVQDISKYIDVYASVFENDSFSEPKLISNPNNELMEYTPLIAADGENVAVAWMTNSENDYHYTKGSNSIYVCEYKDGAWQTPTAYAQNLNYVSDYDVDFVNGKVGVLYAEDADNVSSTQDGTVYYVQNGTKKLIANSDYSAEIVDFCDGKAYFSGGNKLYKVSGDDFSNISDTGIEAGNFSVVKNSSGAEIISFIRQNGFKRDVYASYYKNGTYTSPVPVISNGTKVTNYSVVYNDDGTISFAYNEEEILTDSDYIYGKTDMVVEKNVQPNVFFVDSELYYNAYDVKPQNTIEFSALATNYTASDISKVTLTLTGSSSGEVYKGEHAVNIPMGKRQYINLSYTLPETIANETFTLTVTPENSDHMDLSDNKAVCELGFSDLEISDCKIQNNIITGKVTNVGYKTAENISLSITEDNEENAPIVELSCDKGSLAVGESWEFSQEVSEVVFENVGDVKYYLLTAATDSMENDYANDEATVYSEPVGVTGISLDKSTLTMTEKTSDLLTPTVTPENATFKQAFYTSSDNSVVLVDNAGNVYAVKEGSAIVTAYTLDGSQSAQCEITVEELEEKKYTLSNRGLELMVGDKSSVNLKDTGGNDATDAEWTSTDEKVITISQDGNVEAVGEGIALIVVKNDTFVDACIVRVSDYFIELGNDDISIKVSESIQLNATVSPSDGTVTYSSDNSDIATVSDTGLVTGVAAGNTVIHARYGNASADCQVTVTDNAGGDTPGEDKPGEDTPELVTSIRLDKTDLALKVFETYTLTASVSPETAANKEVEWSTSNSEIASVDQSGLITALSKGTAIITATAKDGSGVSQSCTVTVIDNGTVEDSDDLGDVLKEDVPANGIIPDNLWIAGIDDNGYTYTGEAIKPVVRVYDKKTLLKEKTDYTISYKNNTKAGEATITVTGKGNYSGKDTATFKILPVDISSDDVYAMDFYVKLSKKAQKPVPTLYCLGMKLKNKKDFTVEYSNASGVYSQVGEYSVTVTGTGNYTGTRVLELNAVEKIVKKTPVNISKVKVTGFEKTFDYTGKSCKQECILTVKTSEGEKTLVEGVDYTVQYTNNIKAGTATVMYYGRNGYTGKLKKTYKILPYDILNDSNAKIKYENNFEYIYSKGGSKPKPIVTFDGKVMKEGVDYTLSYKNNKTVFGNQTPCVTVNGKGCFKGKISIHFTIKAQELSKMTLVSGDRVYKNKANIYKITPKLMDLDGKLLSAGRDFDSKSITYVYENDVALENGVFKEAGSEVENTDIIPAGTQIRITLNCGSGSNYTGTFTGTYRITKADIKSAKVTIPKQIYTGNQITLDKSQITVKLSGVTLNPEDYEIIQYADNVKKGTASVTIKGTGNYGGVKTVKFTIGAKGFLWWWRK